MVFRFICSNCGFATNHKSHFDDHIANIKGCNPNKHHGNVKNTVPIIGPVRREHSDEHTDEIFECKVCERSFTRSDSYKRHIKRSKEHAANMNNISIATMNNSNLINGNENTTTNNSHNTTNNSHNTNMNNSHNTNTNNYNLNFAQPQLPPPKHDYLYYNINDLTLYEQYLVFYYNDNVETTPFLNLINLLNYNPNKPDYNNIGHVDFRNGFAKIFNGKQWVQMPAKMMYNIISPLRDQVFFLYNKFRIFLSRRETIFNTKVLYYGIQSNIEYELFTDHIKYHIINKNKRAQVQLIKQNLPPYHDNVPPFLHEAPPERNHETWNSLSKSFKWDDVVFLIDKMEFIGINFLDDIGKIKMNV